MLYDPKWQNTTTKPDVFSLEGLIAWLEKQPAEKTYNFHNCAGACLLDQYGDAMGIPDDDRRYPKLSDAFDGGGPFIAVKTPHTFGAALDRARAALGPRP